MPPQTPTTPKTDSTADDKALREEWGKLSHEEKNAYFGKLPASAQDDFAKRVGLFESQQPVNVSTPPTADFSDFEKNPSPQTLGTSVAKSIPWMKQKALATVNAGANWLPTAGGVVGGGVGGAVGTAGIPGVGTTGGAVIGAGIGGGTGEAARQYIQHKTGYDQFEDSKDKTLGTRAKGVVKEGMFQATGEASGQLAGKWLRPTLERSLSKLYYAGGLSHGDPLGGGDLESVMDDILATEKQTGKAVTVRDFYDTVNQAKKDVGQEVDMKMSAPIKLKSGQVVPLGKAEAPPTEIVNAINSLLTADPSIVKRAALNKAGKEAAYLQNIKKEALAFSQKPWTYEELASERIRLNNELSPIYTLPPGEKRVYMLDHPNLAVAKAEADAIRDTTYPMMDRLSGEPPGTTAALQNKRGALMRLETQINEHLGDIKTKARKAQGAPPLEKVNISSYGTTGGKPGLAVHRLSGLVHTPNPEATADRQVKKAFGHGAGTNIRRVITTPGGSKKAGDELLSMPLRMLLNNYQNDKTTPKPKDDDSSDNQSSVASPKDLKERAKKLNPVGQGQVAYAHHAVNSATGHRVGSNDRGKTWYDVRTGEPVNA